MKYSKATNYALHIIVYMIENAHHEKLGVQKFADHFKVSTPYLSKILTKLVKADLIESTPGAKGGYVLRKKIEDISFLDIINAIEGNGALFKCEFKDSECLIHKTMVEAENRMTEFLQNRKIYEVAQQKGCGGSFYTVDRMISMLEERDALSPIDHECDKFGLKEGDVVIDYGCGSGGYTKKVSELIGDNGKVYAVDLHELAIESVKKKINQYQLKNVSTILVKDIDTIQDSIADIIIAIDMFHMVEDKNGFLNELYRLIKRNGFLFISVHHMTPDEARGIITGSKLWDIADEIGDCLKCVPINK